MDFFKIYLIIFIAVVFVPFDISPFVRLKLSALRTFNLPFALVGGFKLPVCIVVFLSALRQEYSFPQPPESSNARFGLLHMSAWPLPSFVADKPTDRTTLKITFCVRAENPERHAV